MPDLNWFLRIADIDHHEPSQPKREISVIALHGYTGCGSADMTRPTPDEYWIEIACMGADSQKPNQSCALKNRHSRVFDHTLNLERITVAPTMPPSNLP